MVDGPDDQFRKACDGERKAILALCKAKGIDQRIIRHIASWHRGRTRDENEYEANVAARVHYLRGKGLGHDKVDLTNQMIELFGLPRNRAEYLANGNGYEAVREEALRRYRASLQTEQ